MKIERFRALLEGVEKNIEEMDYKSASEKYDELLKQKTWSLESLFNIVDSNFWTYIERFTELPSYRV